MNKFVSYADKLSVVGGVLSGIMICGGVCLVIGEILARSVFNSTLYVAEEYSGYLMAGLTFVALDTLCGIKGTFA